MLQLKNYISQIDTSKLQNLIIIGDSNELEKLADYIAKTVKPLKIYYACGNNDVKFFEKSGNNQAKYYSADELKNIDAVIFDKGNEKALYNIEGFKPRYVIGRMSESEDYFSLWEVYRKLAEHIYIQQSVSMSELGYEIFEWDTEEKDIELSVIIPVYNVEKYLPKCIEELTGWKAEYIEFLFVNDGSTDNSAQLIEKYAKSDKRIKLINKANGGCASARNAGLDSARGRYVGFVDADDFIDALMFKKLLKRAMLGNYELTYCGYNEYYEDTGEALPAKNDCMSEPYRSGTYRTDKIQLLAVNTRVAIWRCLYKKSVLDENNIRFHEDLPRFDDLPFRMEYIFAAKSAVCVPEYLYYYRLGRKGQDVSCTDKRLFVHFDIFRHLDIYTMQYKDKRMADLLQVVKLHTHRYALDRIDRQYKKEYKVRAKAQLSQYAGYFRNVCLILTYAGKSNLGWFTRLWLGR